MSMLIRMIFLNSLDGKSSAHPCFMYGLIKGGEPSHYM